MALQLSEAREAWLRALVLAGRFPSEQAALDEAFRLLEANEGPGDLEKLADDSRAEALQSLLDTIDGLPPEGSVDRFSNRDHDAAIY
jgi:Arc/MetJ-type ribon-helix-helix transcriptional regulator